MTMDDQVDGLFSFEAGRRFPGDCCPMIGLQTSVRQNGPGDAALAHGLQACRATRDARKCSNTHPYATCTMYFKAMLRETTVCFVVAPLLYLLVQRCASW